MPQGNPAGYFQPQFQPTPITPATVPQIPQLPMIGPHSGGGGMMPSLGSLMRPQPPQSGGFDLMSALQQGNQQIQQAQNLAAQMPTPPRPRTPAPLPTAEKPKTIEERIKAMSQGERLKILRDQDPGAKDLIPHIKSQQISDAQQTLKQQRQNRLGGSR